MVLRHERIHSALPATRTGTANPPRAFDNLLNLRHFTESTARFASNDSYLFSCCYVVLEAIPAVRCRGTGGAGRSSGQGCLPEGPELVEPWWCGLFSRKRVLTQTASPCGNASSRFMEFGIEPFSEESSWTHERGFADDTRRLLRYSNSSKPPLR